MARQTRQRKSTLANVVNSFDSVQKLQLAPVPLTDQEQVYFVAVIHARESDTWSDNDKVLAANIARTAAAIDDLWADVRTCGYMVTNGKGEQVPNPALDVIHKMTSTLQMLNRTLGLSASQRGLSGVKQAGRNKADQMAREVINAAADSLLS